MTKPTLAVWKKQPKAVFSKPTRYRPEGGKSTKNSPFIYLASFLALLLSGIVAIPYYYQLKWSYLSPAPARRINDFEQFSTAATKAIIALSIPAFIPLAIAGMLASGTKPLALSELPVWVVITSIVYLLVLAGVLAVISCWLAAVHFGTVVDPTKDRVVFRVDQESYDLTDYLTLKFITDLPKFDMVPISAIGRITRMHGTDLYLMGDFGSRRISFAKKQKRDECIYALTSSGLTNAKVMTEFEST